jgi:hypothetical protein
MKLLQDLAFGYSSMCLPKLFRSLFRRGRKFTARIFSVIALFAAGLILAVAGSPPPGRIPMNCNRTRNWSSGLARRLPWILGLSLELSLGFFAISLLSIPTFAHHSMSMYDRGRSVTFKATITNYDFTNPHVQIHFQVVDEKGGVAEWMAECPSPGRLSRAGWTENMLKPGDQITITGNPSKDGAFEMRLDQIVLPNGQQMTAYYRR